MNAQQRWLCSVLCVCLMVCTGAEAAGQESSPAVLVLYGDDPAQPWITSLIAGVSQANFNHGSGSPDLSFEFLDARRFGQQRQVELLHGALREKYRDVHFRLIVSVQAATFPLAARLRETLWPETPILFVLYGGARPDPPERRPGDSVLGFESTFEPLLATAKELFPDTRRVALVWETSNAFRERVRQAGLEPIDVVGESLEEVRTQLANLPPETVAILGGSGTRRTEDGSPMNLTWPLCELSSRTANRPTFMQGVHFLGCGIVGGRLRNFELIGRIIGERILTLVAGAPAPVDHIDLSQFTQLQFDARQLRRWQVAESRLPAGSAVLFREPSVWRDHQSAVMTAIAAIAVQTLLIVGLLYERRRRRVAEADSRQSLSMLTRVDRQASLGVLTGAIAHELGQPLGALKINADVAERLAQQSTTDPQILSVLRDIRTESQRAAHIVERHRAMLRSHVIEERPIELASVVHESVSFVGHDAQVKNIHIDVRAESVDATVVGDRVLLQEVLLNLLLNAMDAVADMPAERRRIVVSLTRNQSDACITVRDFGDGLSPGVESKLFEPFVTTKPNGIGIGLSISRRIAEAHRGTIEARNHDDRGAILQLTLPLARSATEPVRQPNEPVSV